MTTFLVLDLTPEPETPEQIAARIAKELIRVPKQSLSEEFAKWRASMVKLWKNPEATPEAILAAIGTDAAELFILSGAKVAFFESVKPGCTAEVSAWMTPFEMNEDGTVTLTESW